MLDPRQPEHRNNFPHFQLITTRWMDNDLYGHVNNVQYYSFFDTAVNRFLIDHNLLDIHSGELIGLVVETHCNYFRSAAFPDDIHAGLRIAHLGNSSVRYELGLFLDAQDLAIAQGHFIHVYVDRSSRKPVTIPDKLRATLSILVVPGK